MLLGALTAVCGGLFLLIRPKRREVTCAVVRLTAEEKNAVARISYLLTLTALLARPHNVKVIAVFAPGAEKLGETLTAAFPNERRLHLCAEKELPAILRDCCGNTEQKN